MDFLGLLEDFLGALMGEGFDALANCSEDCLEDS